jgi:Zn-dependent protease/predicted transcriptional regulator
MKTSIKILRVFGIPIELDASFLILIIFIYVMAFLKLISLQLAVLITLIFVTVVIHELSHSYMAQRYGVEIERIVLLPIGGVSQMSEIPHSPRQELLISVVGPLTNMAIALVIYLIYLGTNSFLPDIINSFLLEFTMVNIVLGLFNLVPAFPMDGGRILRAALAQKMDYLRATEISVYVGKLFAIIMAIAGFYISIFLILIALFIYIGADQEYKATLISALLTGMKVKEIMTRDVKTLSPHDTVEHALEKMFEYKHMGYPVTENGNILGIVTFHDLSRVEDRKYTQLSEIMTSDLITAQANEEVASVLEKISINKLGRLPVVEGDKLVGIISKTDIVKVLDLMKNRTK